MPHIVIEYSDTIAQELQESKLMASTHQTVVDSGLFNPEFVKARSIAYTDYILPQGTTSFVHINVSILDGRPLDKRQALSEAVFKNAQNLLPTVKKISVNIIEMDKKTYQK